MRFFDVPERAFELGRETLQIALNGLRGRRVWSREGRAHIEARGLRSTELRSTELRSIDPGEYAAALEQAVSTLDGVRWAAVNRALGDVVVEFDPESVRVETLRSAVARVERSCGISGVDRDPAAHPGDPRR